MGGGTDALGRSDRRSKGRSERNRDDHPRNEGYEDVVPELIAEDALHVHTYGWPEGFEVEVLNQAG